MNRIRQIITGKRWGRLVLSCGLVLGAIVFLSYRTGPAASVETSVTAQERIGSSFQVLARLDRAWSASAEQRLQQIRHQDRRNVAAQPGRRQEVLGIRISESAAAIRAERLRLAQAISVASIELQDFEAAGRATIQARTFDRLTSNLALLRSDAKTLEADIPMRTAEAIAVGERTAQMQFVSQRAWAERASPGLQAQSDWRRPIRDYLELGAWVQSGRASPVRASGFVEYGLPAVAGLMMCLVGVAVMVNRD